MPLVQRWLVHLLFFLLNKIVIQHEKKKMQADVCTTPFRSMYTDTT